MKFCPASHRGEKFPTTIKSYYIEMANDSVLCEPFITMDELQHYNAMHLTRESHTSKEWEALLSEFHARNGT
jgi:hypothetical protein